ncbi:hypothetical protein H7F33_19850 [Pedobacter sp. PAMC26386]|nr:hypothetical protein H7F33_19850 [Pedobacter sp. PAMC26386]
MYLNCKLKSGIQGKADDIIHGAILPNLGYHQGSVLLVREERNRLINRVTKVIAGIGYASISDPSKLKCIKVEHWLINKINDDEFQCRLVEKGIIDDDGVILWNS